MRISVTEAKGQLTELVSRAEAGEEVVLTRHGKATVKLVPVRLRPDAEVRRTVIARVRTAAASKCLTFDGCQCRPQPGFFVRRQWLA